MRYYLIAPYQIHYLRFIIEAYPGYGRRIDSRFSAGAVSIAIAPGCEPDVLRILEAERDVLKLHEVASNSVLANPGAILTKSLMLARYPPFNTVQPSNEQK